MKPEEFEVYVIPPNFMEGGTLFGGLLKTRNTIEAVILGLAVGVPVLHLPFSLTVRVVILCLTALPLVLLALIGVSGMSLSAFIRLFFCFLHNRRILSRDGTQGGKNGKTLLPSWAQQRKSDCEAEDPPLPKSRSRFSVDLKQRSVTQFKTFLQEEEAVQPLNALTDYIPIETEEERREVIWHEIKTSHIAGRILTGTLDGVEQTPSGRTIVVVDYKGYRIAIPLKEMMLYSGPVPYGAKYKPFMERMNSILATMLTAEIDFIVRGLDNTARSVVASRKAAMLRKRQTFYLDTNEDGVPMIYEGRVVQARVIGVAEKVLRVEVFGVECTIFARDLSAAWFGDAREYYSVGDRVLVRVLTIDRDDINHISITADIRSVSSTANQSNLDKCVLQGKYAGRVTDVRHGVVFIRLNNGVNAVAHTCYDRRMPGKKDDVSFAVTRLDEERGIAVGIITRIIKQNL